MSVRYAEECTALDCSAVNRYPVIARLSLVITSFAPIRSVDRCTDMIIMFIGLITETP